MGKFEAGDNPADHTNAEVVEFLTGDECTPDEYDRVMEAERGGRNRVGILNGTGADEPAPVAPDEDAPAGPNEAATGQESPADEAKTVDDPQASGDAGVTADQYPDDAPASLGPDMPQSQAEAGAHIATLESLAAAEASDVSRPKTQTPEQARALAAELSQQWKTPRNSAAE